MVVGRTNHNKNDDRINSHSGTDHGEQMELENGVHRQNWVQTDFEIKANHEHIILPRIFSGSTKAFLESCNFL